MDENYNPTDAELYAIFGEEPPAEEEDPNARIELPQVDPLLGLGDDLPPPNEPNPFDEPSLFGDPFLEPEPVRGSWAQPPTIYIGQNSMPPNSEKPTPDTPAEKEPRKHLHPGDQVTVVGYVFAQVDEEKRSTRGEPVYWRFHRTVWRTECRAVRCLFLGWTQMQGGWREPASGGGGGWDGESEYEPPSFQADKYVNVAVVMPLDIHDRSKFRKPFRCLPSQIIVESSYDFLINLGERNRKFNQ